MAELVLVGLGGIAGACGLAAIQLFRTTPPPKAAPLPTRLSAGELATPPHRAPHLRAAHPTRARRDWPVDREATAAMGTLDPTGVLR